MKIDQTTIAAIVARHPNLRLIEQSSYLRVQLADQPKKDHVPRLYIPKSKRGVSQVHLSQWAPTEGLGVRHLSEAEAPSGGVKAFWETEEFSSAQDACKAFDGLLRALEATPVIAPTKRAPGRKAAPAAEVVSAADLDTLLG